MYKDNYRGNIINRYLVGDFRVVETHFTKGLKLLKHAHSNAMLSIIEYGNFTENVSNKLFEIKKFDILYKPSFTPHSNFFFKSVRCLTIELPYSIIKNAEKLGMNLKKAFNINNHSKNLNLLTRIRNELKNKNSFSEKILEGIVYEIFEIEYLRSRNENRDTPKWIENLLNEINKIDYNLTLNELSKIADKNPIYIINSFKKYLDITPGEYLRKRKYELICNELISTNKPIVDIVYQFNFFDESHFYKFFKKYAGNTPTFYREIHKN